MGALKSNIFSDGEDAKIFAPMYKRTKEYEAEDVYNVINGIYNDTVESYLESVDGEARDLFSYDYTFRNADGQEVCVHTDVSCNRGNVIVVDESGQRTLFIPGPDTLERSKNYLAALYIDMGYVEFKNIKIAG